MATIRPRGKGWQAIVRVKREGQLIINESRTFSTEKLARHWAAKVEKDVKDNGPASRAGRNVTIGTLLEKYHEELNRARPRSRQRDGQVDLIARTKLAKVPVSGLRSQHLVDFAKERRDMGAGPATVAVDWSLISSALGAAKPMFGVVVDTTLLDEARPALDKLNLIGRPQERDRRVSADEEARLIAEFERVARHPSTVIPMAEIVRFALACPRRLGEIVRLRWDDVDRGNKVVLLRDVKHPRRKMGNHQQVPLVGESWAIAMRQPVLSEFIFPYKGDSVSASFERAVKRLGIEDMTFHDLRHEGITRLFEAGLSIQQVALVSGHRSWTTLRKYTHLRAESVHEALKNAGSQATQEAGAEPQGHRPGDDRHPDGQDV